MTVRILERSAFDGGEKFAPYRTKIVWAPVLPQDRSRLVEDEARLVAAGIHSRRTAAGVAGGAGPGAGGGGGRGGGQAEEPFGEAQDRPLGLPKGSVRSMMSLGVVVAAGAIAGFLLVEDTTADLTKIVVGGWVAALGNVIGVYFRGAGGEESSTMWGNDRNGRMIS